MLTVLTVLLLLMASGSSYFKFAFDFIGKVPYDLIVFCEPLFFKLFKLLEWLKPDRPDVLRMD